MANWVLTHQVENKKKKKKNQYPKGVEKHFIFITFFSNSQQINYTRLPALPKFPPSTSISQSVYCLLWAFPSAATPSSRQAQRVAPQSHSQELRNGTFPVPPPPRRHRSRSPLSGASFLKHALRQRRGVTRGQSHAHFCE